MRFRSVPQLTTDALTQLVQAGLRESRTLDFKRDAVGLTDADKREFAADVSAFANTGGGHLFFGVDEAEGVAISIPGIELANPDAEIQRLNNVLLTGLEPRLPSVEFEWLPLEDGRGVIAVHTQRSWAAPHRVSANRHFHRRNSSGKYSMDVQELRSAFGERDQAHTTFRQYVMQRAVAIFQGESAIRTVPRPLLLLHVIPLSSYYELGDLSEKNPKVWIPPLANSGGWNRRYVLEGFANTAPANDDGTVEAYSLLSRNGSIEGAAAVGGESNGSRWVDLPEISDLIWNGAKDYLKALIELDVSPPWFVFISLVGVKGTRQWSREPWNQRRLPPFHNDYAFVPEVVIGSPEEAEHPPIERAIDQLWNGYGMPAPKA